LRRSAAPISSSPTPTAEEIVKANEQSQIDGFRSAEVTLALLAPHCPPFHPRHPDRPTWRQSEAQITPRAFVVDALLLLVATGTILRRVVRAADVDFRTILGAISVFTLLGLLFGFLFIALGRMQSGDVFTGVARAETRDYLFFSYTTLTTTGYGNLGPAGDIGQILAVFEMLTGQIFLVTLVAGLVSLWRPAAGARMRPAGE
jgi:voltage-gated potassium channel Kch